MFETIACSIICSTCCLIVTVTALSIIEVSSIRISGSHYQRTFATNLERMIGICVLAITIDVHHIRLIGLAIGSLHFLEELYDIIVEFLYLLQFFTISHGVETEWSTFNLTFRILRVVEMFIITIVLFQVNSERQHNCSIIYLSILCRSNLTVIFGKVGRIHLDIVRREERLLVCDDDVLTSTERTTLCLECEVIQC